MSTHEFNKIRIQATDGASAEIYLYGAHLASWQPAGAAEQLFMSPLAEFRVGISIRGGVPIVFPQFAELGPLPKHGLLRTMVWDCVNVVHDSGAGRAGALFRARDDARTRAIWPQDFAAEFHVEIGAKTLTMTFTVRNTGAMPFQFTAALHSYLHVGDIADVEVQGLHGLRYIDKVAGSSVQGPQRDLQLEQSLRIAGEVDRIYLESNRPITLRDGARSLEVNKSGFEDVVIWNPGAALSARLKDLGLDGYRTMLCIEAAVIAVPISLQPGAEWRGTQQLRLLS